MKQEANFQCKNPHLLTPQPPRSRGCVTWKTPPTATFLANYLLIFTKNGLISSDSSVCSSVCHRLRLEHCTALLLAGEGNVFNAAATATSDSARAAAPSLPFCARNIAKKTRNLSINRQLYRLTQTPRNLQQLKKVVSLTFIMIRQISVELGIEEQITGAQQDAQGPSCDIRVVQLS